MRMRQCYHLKNCWRSMKGLILNSRRPQGVMVEAKYHKVFGPVILRWQTHKTERLALATASIESKVTNQRLQQITTDHPHDLTIILQSLVDRGYLTRYGVGRGAYYRLKGKNREIRENRSLFQELLTDSSEQMIGNSEQIPVPDSEQMLDNSEQMQDIDPLIQRVRATSKISSEQIEQAILHICKDHFMTLHEIATLLNRSGDTLRTHYINKMVRQGKLQMRYPKTLNHPAQAYQTLP